MSAPARTGQAGVCTLSGAGPSSVAPGTDEALVTQALEEYWRQLEAGQVPNRREFLARYPTVAAALSECLAGLDLVRALAPGRPPDDYPAVAGQEVAGEGMPVPSLSDFRIVREVGRGGMGVVYEAEQLSLGRRVALKVLPLAIALDPRHLQRFKNEAQAAAQLHHPHIVPVYAVGCEQGVHYYAMQFIDGLSLAQAVEQLQGVSGRSAAVADATVDQPAFFRMAARVGVQAALALEHAHQQGIVHRDVKPGNLILDGRGNAWVADFGLARQPGDAGLTVSGDVLGTLRYMSPEQAQARHGILDQRSDVYSLGVTLYELVTLQPAFAGTDREELLRQVCHEEPRPPRRLNRAVPVDLETVILKAIHKEPGCRYATARELADDLRRFLNNEPVRARRATWPERFRSWRRRHPAAARSAGFLAAAVTACLAVTTVFVWRAEREAEEQRQVAENASNRARERARLAVQAVDDMYAEADRWLSHMPGADVAEETFLRRALALYEQFARESSDDPALRLKVAQVHGRIGEIHRKLGHYEQAEAAWEQARLVLDAIPAPVRATAGFRFMLVTYHHAQGGLHVRAGRVVEAERSLCAAGRLLDGLLAEWPDDPVYRYELATSSADLGLLLRQAGRAAEARAASLRAVTLLRRLMATHPEYPLIGGALAQAENNYGNLLEAAGRPSAAESADTHRMLGDRRPAPDACRAEGEPRTARAAGGACDVHREPGDPHEAVAALAGGLVGGVGTTGPLSVLAGAAQGRRVAQQQADYREAEMAYRRAIDLLEPLTARHPAYPALRYDLAITWHNLGWLRGHAGDVEAAGAAYRRAARHLEKLVQDFPAIPHYQDTLEGVRRHSAQLPDRRNDRAQASALVVPARGGGGGQGIHRRLPARRPACRLLGPPVCPLLD